MPSFRYPQTCAIARAAEVVGERWMLLVLRELALGPRRFTDLRERLSGVSASVLTARLAHLREKNLIRRTTLPPPAASAVYALTEEGRSLLPVLYALLRWGVRYLGAPEPDDKFEAEWLRLGLAAYARRSESPACAIEIQVTNNGTAFHVVLSGGPDGTVVSEGSGPADLSLTVPSDALLGLVNGAVRPADALATGALRAEGNLELLDLLPQFFDMSP
ncbi:MAG: winged helix-turn-helix transcriptional regulator [Myxococcota bacterium]